MTTTTIRTLQAKDEQAAIALADETFRSQEHVSMGTAYPYVFSSAVGQSYGLFEGEKMVAFIGLVPSVVRVGAARLQVYSIGAVCTHADARGRGYASELMSAVLGHADAAGASLILISGNRTLYTRYGCYPFGSMRKYSLEQAHLAQIRASYQGMDVAIRPWRHTDLFDMTALASGRHSAYEQTVTELLTLIQTAAYASNVKMRHEVWVAERQGKVVAYTIMGMSDDPTSERPPFIVEWAGEIALIPVIVADAMDKHKWQKLNFQVSGYETALHERLRGVPVVTGRNSGLVHVVQMERLCEQLTPYLQAYGMSSEQLATRLAPLSAEERIEFLFGQLEESSVQTKEQPFPLPFPYTVGLNYV